MKKRIQRLNQLIKREVAQLILREIDWEESGWRSGNVLVTVTRAEVTPDLKESKVYVSTIPEENEEQVLTLLNKKIFLLQKKIDKRLKMRPVPKISFWKEKSTAEAGRVEEILEKLKLKK
jgi:ribosome-binding factor A